MEPAPARAYLPTSTQTVLLTRYASTLLPTLWPPLVGAMGGSLPPAKTQPPGKALSQETSTAMERLTQSSSIPGRTSTHTPSTVRYLLQVSFSSTAEMATANSSLRQQV